MGTRLELNQLLKDLMPDGEQNVYFQEPTNVAMKYPCIRYDQNDEDVIHGDNLPYRRVKRWEITIIDRDPDSLIPDVIASLPMCTFNRRYQAENLNHTVYNLFF